MLEAPSKSRGGDVVVYEYTNHTIFTLKVSLSFFPHFTDSSTPHHPATLPHLSTARPLSANHGHRPSPRRHRPYSSTPLILPPPDGLFTPLQIPSSLSVKIYCNSQLYPLKFPSAFAIFCLLVDLFCSSIIGGGGNM